MFKTIVDFERTWTREAEGTLKLLQGLTDASLAQAVEPAGRNLGRLAWHLTLTLGEMMDRTGLKVDGPKHDAPVPGSVAAIVHAYQKASASLLDQIHRGWQDETLTVEDDMYGEKWRRGMTLGALVLHQAHHRGQMTVLMRQAGLRVPGVYGPAREEWGAFGAEAPAI